MQFRRTRSLALLFLGVGLLALGACSDPDSPEPGASEQDVGPDRPHVIVISIDTLRADHLGAYGYERDTSPNLDLFAKTSVLFERCFSTAPWTLVSHMSLLTGLYPGQHRVVSDKNALSPDNPTLAERFQEAGYQTASFHVPGWIDERYGFSRGFDVDKIHGNAYDARANLGQYLDQRDDDRPMFVFVHLFDVHSAPMGEKDKLIYRPPAEYRTLYHPDPEGLFEPGDAYSMWYDNVKPNREQREALIALYDGGIRFVDHMLGQWLSDWRREGWLDDAVVVITSDHGETLGQRGGIVRAHGGLYNDGLHIPLMVRLPGAERAGERIARPVNQVDIAPTLQRLAGIEVEEFLPGVDLLSGAEQDPDHVMEARWGTDYAFLQWPIKVVQSTEEKRPQFVADLEADAAEREVLDRELDPAAHAEALSRLRAEFKAQIAALPLPDRVPGRVSDEMSEVERERLAALGYAEHTEDGPESVESPEPAESSGSDEPPADPSESDG